MLLRFLVLTVRGNDSVLAHIASILRPTIKG